jgi:hypothetical protein
VWLFAVLGTLLAAAQLLLYSGIAAADRLSAVAVWTAVAVECSAVELLVASSSLTTLTLAVTAALSAAALVTVGLGRLTRAAG